MMEYRNNVLKWKFRKYFIGQNIKGNGILPDPEVFKTSINVFSIHDGFIS